MTQTDEFEQFMRNYQNMVYSTAVRLLGNETDAADISQEVFLKAYERYAELSSSPRAGGWLKTVTTNLCLNHLTRYRNRWKFFSEMFAKGDEEHGDDYSATLAAPEMDPAFDESYEHGVLQDALKKLPAAQRVPLVLYHFEDMSYDQIARKTGVSVGKVKTDIHRGREALRGKLARNPEGEIASKYPSPRTGPTLMGCV
jgi:RNA polymerase sigma-70 factor (ECF subfamily)